MSEDDYRDLFKALREHQHNYTYFLLTAAGAAIALAVNQTPSEALSWPQALLGVAVLIWGASFWSGCRHLNYVSSVLIADGALLSVTSGQHPDIGNQLKAMKAAGEGIKSALETNIANANLFFAWQFRLSS